MGQENPPGTVYRGTRNDDGDPIVLVGRAVLTPTASKELKAISVYGFEWGFEGVGPGQLALALLLDATNNPELALRLWPRFKRDHVCRFAKRSWMMTREDVRGWAATNA